MEGAEIEPKCFCIMVTFCGKGCFCRNALFLHMGSLSAEVILNFCRKLLAKMFLQKPIFVQKSTSFCRKAGLSVNYGFLTKLSAFCILSFGFGRHHFGWSLVKILFAVHNQLSPTPLSLLRWFLSLCRCLIKFILCSVPCPRLIALFVDACCVFHQNWSKFCE